MSPPEPARLRPIDLARAAGISTQQVRNYETAGILPPVPRSPTGYRRFSTVHRDALLTYRALAAGHGPVAAQQIMTAVNTGDTTAALAIIDTTHTDLAAERKLLTSTAEALETLATAPEPPARPNRPLRIGEVARQIGVRSSALRVWEDAGLLTPSREPGTGYRRYGPHDVRDARMIAMLRRGHYRFPQIQTIVDGLRETGSSRALRAAVAQRHAALADRGKALLRGAARLHHYLTGENAVD